MNGGEREKVERERERGLGPGGGNPIRPLPLAGVSGMVATRCPPVWLTNAEVT